MPAGQGHKVTAEPAAGGEGPPATKAAQTTTGSTTVLTDQKISTRKLFQLAIKAIFRPREPAARSTWWVVSTSTPTWSFISEGSICEASPCFLMTPSTQTGPGRPRILCRNLLGSQEGWTSRSQGGPRGRSVCLALQPTPAGCSSPSALQSAGNGPGKSIPWTPLRPIQQRN